MMNILAICLVATSLATAGVLSPSPEKQNPRIQQEDVIVVKEGHRVVVVEYEREDVDGNTRVSISPQDPHLSHKPPSEEKIKEASSLSAAQEKFKEASSVLPNLGQGLSGSSEPSSNGDHGHGHSTPGELICDVFGKCKHQIETAFGKSKEKVSEKAHEVEETVSHKAHQVGKGVKDVSREAAREAKQGLEVVVDTSKTVGEEIERNVSTKIDTAKGQVKEKAKQAEEMAAERVKTNAERLKKEGRKDLHEILRRGREVANDAMIYVDSLMGSVVHLLGFSMAYGMCNWVTFVSSYVLAEALPRQQFGMVQSKIYPVYFRAMASCVGVALFGHLFSHRKQLFTSMPEMFQGFNLLASIFILLANLLYLEPRATKVMFERMKMEKEEGRGRDGFMAEPSSKVADPVADPAATTVTGATTTTPAATAERLEKEAVKSRLTGLNERLKKLNTYSSFLNILTLMALTWHLVYLGQRLGTTC